MAHDHGPDPSEAESERESEVDPMLDPDRHSRRPGRESQDAELNPDLAAGASPGTRRSQAMSRFSCGSIQEDDEITFDRDETSASLAGASEASLDQLLGRLSPDEPGSPRGSLSSPTADAAAAEDDGKKKKKRFSRSSLVNVGKLAPEPNVPGVESGPRTSGSSTPSALIKARLHRARNSIASRQSLAESSDSMSRRSIASSFSGGTPPSLTPQASSDSVGRPRLDSCEEDDSSGERSSSPQSLIKGRLARARMSMAERRASTVGRTM
jgi:hypothetical protein